MNARARSRPRSLKARRVYRTPGLGWKPRMTILHLSHLRRPLRARKRPDRDLLQPGLGQRVEQADLVGHRDGPTLDLHAVAHALLAVANARINGHQFPRATWVVRTPGNAIAIRATGGAEPIRHLPSRRAWPC